MSNPYRSAILDHSRAPHRRGALAQATHCGCGENALCGDSLSVQLCVEAGRIVDYAFEAEACAIVVATASMLGDALVGHAPTQLEVIEADLRRLLGQIPPEPDEALAVRLGALADLAEMRALPRRHRCVTLALEAVRAALVASSRADRAK
ncbi:MAG: iron-sulfur cluster assembly scaffold protein [Lysobacterales bacterium]|jgi:nitrogen fixation NifU-like protein